jgi:Domain of unknown function (DUF4160)
MMLQDMNAKEAKRAIEIVAKHQDQLLEKWEEFHG